MTTVVSDMTPAIDKSKPRVRTTRVSPAAAIARGDALLIRLPNVYAEKAVGSHRP